MDFWDLWHGKISCQPCYYSSRSNNNTRQPNLNLREPSFESSTVRPKLKILPRTVKGPVNIVVHTERNASIFGTGKPREPFLVNETKRTLSELNKGQGQLTVWRKTLASGYQRFLLSDKFICTR